MNCPVCDSTDNRHFVSLPAVPLFCNVLLDSREEALSVPRGDISLVACNICGHVYNTAFEPERLAYAAGYENSLHFSEHFQNYATSVAARLVENHHLVGGTVAEIGCGHGDFLQLLVDRGVDRAFGFDPVLAAAELRKRSDDRVTLLGRPIFDIDPGIELDLICCRHVLEHLAEPGVLLRRVVSIAGARRSVLYLEVPNADFVMRDLSVWDIIYEHCSYFTEGSLLSLVETQGFEVLDSRASFQGQYLSVDVRAGRETVPLTSPSATLGRGEDPGFARLFAQRRQQGEERLAHYRSRRSVLWGAGSKGVSALNSLEESVTIEAAVDLNPRKHGKYTPGTGHRVVSPEDLTTIDPDLVWLTNVAYQEEISTHLRQLGLAPQVVLL